MSKWGIVQDLICPLCDSEDEFIERLFFKYAYSAELWSRLLKCLGIQRAPMGWGHELNWAIINAKGKNIKAEIYKIVMVGSVYYLWLERNQRIFQEKHRSIEVMSKLIVQDIHFRGNCYAKIAGHLKLLNFYP